MIFLQAAMAFGLLLELIAGILIFVCIPVLTAVFYLRHVAKNKSAKLSKIDTLKIIGTSLLKSVLIIGAIAIVIFLLLFLIVDLSES